MTVGESWLAEIGARVAEDGSLVRVTVAEAEGSAPREAGAAMLVSCDRVTGTIGGGALEFDAIATAKAMLDAPAAPWLRDSRTVPLGPSLGQCCGGSVRLGFERFGPEEAKRLAAAPEKGLAVRPLLSGVPITVAASRRRLGDWPAPAQRAARAMLSGERPAETRLLRRLVDGADWLVEPVTRLKTRLFLYGAGHVGRALAHVLKDLPLDIAWIDVAPERFPDPVPEHATRVVAADPAAIAAQAPAGALHLVMTFSHPLDLAICAALMRRDNFARLGLIGSASKRARFLKRLAEAGVSPDALMGLTCPIGLGELKGKAPPVIALSVGAQVAQWLEEGVALAPGSVRATG